MLGPGASVGGDLAVGALSLENQAGSVVNGDLLIGAYQALLAGQPADATADRTVIMSHHQEYGAQVRLAGAI